MYEVDTFSILKKLSAIKKYLDRSFSQKFDLKNSAKSNDGKCLNIDQFIEDFNDDEQEISKFLAKIKNSAENTHDRKIPMSHLSPATRNSPSKTNKPSSYGGNNLKRTMSDDLSIHLKHSLLTSFETRNYLNMSDVEKYWSRFNQIVSDENKIVWHGLELGLTKYLIVLKKRESLVNMCIKLRRLNYELCHCLKNYLSEN